MKRTVHLRPGAIADVADAARFYEAARRGYGACFRERVRQILKRLEDMPEIYGKVWKEVRAARLRQFRHVLYLVVLTDRVEVFAIVHGSRAASTWKKRAQF